MGRRTFREGTSWVSKFVSELLLRLVKEGTRATPKGSTYGIRIV
jgi:hypothetical protein